MKILIVDDDLVDRKIIINALGGTKEARDITQTSSVKEGLAQLEHTHFDIILLDYKMPKADGIEMLYELRARNDLGNTAVVMVSASEETELALACIEAGAQDFIVKGEISQGKLQKAMVHAQKRFEIEQKMHQSYIAVKQMAERDPLTGLSNRYHFEETLKVMIANNKRTKHSIALLALDLDNFKYVNDTFGHDAGDTLLVMMVGRINGCLRQNEGFARLGGDEFAIILGGIAQINDVSVIADRILETVAEPFVLDDKEVYCGMSIGVAIFPADATKAEDLVKSADIAMYRAKQSGKNRVCYYESQFQAEFNHRYAIQTDIHECLKNERFTLHYQPIFELNSSNIVGFEALIRWPSDASKHYTPDKFIPIAEDTRQIIELGRWVFEQAVAQLKQWRSNSTIATNLSMSINVSPVQLRDEEFVSLAQQIVNDYGLPASSITLEITETAFFEDQSKIQQSLTDLSTLGFKIALDDFGMGYSSISHLMNYPIDIVKIDKSLQANQSNKSKAEMFEALVLMLSKLSFEIVAEGVEQNEQLSLCQKLEVQKGQGYLLGRPMPKTDAGKLL
ncbi:putative bifunctional diguanylate cyclase/phosphodiesterase [Ningiella sp. W23]|uniref:putative bifunctional diguanylate cyclase/phosphodiesterase n=1 Tax=Ningiella sp. W23 TaxID=3023715 RepID=UPI003756FCE1